MDRENGRQLFHIFVGICTMIVLHFFGRTFVMVGIFFTIIIGTLMINIRLQGEKIPIVSWFEENFERSDALLPGWGSACYATGALLAIVFLHDPNQIMAVLIALAFGDGVSTIVGRTGKIRLPFNQKKTFEGFVAMFLASLLAYFFIGPPALGLAIVAALAESLPWIDDNLSIPIACTIFLMII